MIKGGDRHEKKNTFIRHCIEDAAYAGGGFFATAAQ